MRNYKIEVLFRYVDNGEWKSDFEIFDVKSDNFEQASQKALEEFKQISNAIPFAVKNLDVWMIL